MDSGKIYVIFADILNLKKSLSFTLEQFYLKTTRKKVYSRTPLKLVALRKLKNIG